MKEKTATFMQKVNGFRSDAELWKLSEPISYEVYDYDNNVTSTHETAYVIVSAVSVPISGDETYIFPSDKSGNVLNWGELEGSFRGALDHKEALRNAGFDPD